MNNQNMPLRGHPRGPPCSAPKPRRPSSVLPLRFDLTRNGGTPSFIRLPRPIKCSSVAGTSAAAATVTAPPPAAPAHDDVVADCRPSASSPVSSEYASSSSPPPPPPSSAGADDDAAANSPPKYDVFISFHGKETRENFTSHLYDALCRAGMETFIDSEELQTGEEIGPALIGAIARSKISVVVFSKNYASSKWCLSELAEIVECRRTRGQIVLPVFLDVEPTEVRRQTGSYRVAFAKHEKVPEGSEMAEKVKQWRNALTEVANLSGFDSAVVRPESKLVDEIITCVLEKLETLSLCDDEGLVGVHSLVKEMEELLGNGSFDVLSMGICGMGGTGKTAIAGAIFNRLYGQFDSHCFLANVREESERHGLTSLRNELLRQILGQTDINIATHDIGCRIIRDRLRRRKALIVLDDVSSISQLDFLVKDPTCFGPGSRIIITSRDKDVLKSVDEIYEVKGLAEIDALELFSQCAFKQNGPPEDYLQMSKSVVAYARGLPLAIEVLGSFLHRKSITEWKSTLSRLQRIPNKDIQKILRVSYDGLEEEEKQIFLDAACFLEGEDRSFVANFLNACGVAADIGIRSLVDKSLITFSEDRLQIHDLLRDMAREIVRQESTRDPSKRSRLWEPDEIYDVLTRSQVTEAIEGISLNLSEVEEMSICSRAFECMRNLRFLRIYSSRIDKEDSNLHLLGRLDYLPNLKFLRWDKFPLQTLPTGFTENLVELHMTNSHLKYLWKGPVHLDNLRGIDLSHSRFLEEIPDLSNAPKLERIISRGCRNLTSIPTLKSKPKSLELLDLSGCTNLKAFPQISWNIKRLLLADTAIEEIPPSIENFYQLVILDMNNCKMLKTVPSVGQKLGKLEFLDLSGCSNVASFPEISWNLEVFLLNETAIEEIPSSIKHMEKLELLDLKNCKRLQSLPSSICELKSLQELNLSGSSNFSSFPEITETMDRLNYLSLDGTAIRGLPSSIENLTGLYSLDLGSCKSLVSLPDGLCKLKSLEDLNLSGCSNLENLPQGLGNLESLRTLRASGCKSDVIDFLVGSTHSLRILHLSDCGITEFPDGLTLLSSLTELELSRNSIKSVPSSIKQLRELQSLDLSYCQELQFLTQLPARLTKLIVLNCKSLETVVLNESSELQLYPLNNVETYVFANCPMLDQHALDNIKAFAECRIRVLASHLSVILNFRGFPQNEWMTPQQMRYLLSSLYDHGDFHEALRGLYKAFFGEERLLTEPPSSLLSRVLHDFRERYRLDTQGLLGFFSLIAHLYLSCQGKPSTNFCLPGTHIPDWFCHQKNGSSIAVMVQAPVHSNDNSILAGFAICVVVAFDDYNDDKGINIKCECCFQSDHYGTYDGTGYLRGWDGKKCEPVSVEGDHLFLGYDSSLLVDAAKKINRFVEYSRDLVNVSVKFYAVDEDGNPLKSCTVKKCAIQPLYISDMTKSQRELSGRQDITRVLPRNCSGFLTKVLGNLDLFGAISLGILNVLGNLSVEVVHKGGYVYIAIKCQNTGLPIGLQIFNVHLGIPPLSGYDSSRIIDTVKLTEPPEHSQDPRTVSIEFSNVYGDNNHHTHGVKKCNIRPLENNVMMCYLGFTRC